MGGGALGAHLGRKDAIKESSFMDWTSSKRLHFTEA